MEKKALYLVYFSEFTARFCTWAIISQLLVHLIDIHWHNSSQQLYMVGSSLSFLYMSTIFGGLIKDWGLDGKLVVMLGLGLAALGCLLLLIGSYYFYAGLGVTLLGVGMVTPNTPLLLLPLVSSCGDKIFTVLYGITNAGVILGAVLGGVVNAYFAWHGILLLNELMLAVWFGCCYYCSWLSISKGVDKIKLLKLVLSLLVVDFVGYFYLRLEIFSKLVLVVVGVTYLGFLCFLMVKNKALRYPLMYSTFLVVMAIIFFSGEFQVASTLVDYAKNFVALNSKYGVIPAGSLLALESIAVVLGAFFIARVKYLSSMTNVQTKVAIGLFLGFLAFIVLYGSTLLALQNSISILWLVLAFALLGLGDVYLMPPIMAYVTKSAPLNYKGRLMAGMYFSLSLSGYFSGLMGSSLSRRFVEANTNLNFYNANFGLMALVLGAAAVLVFIMKVTGAIDCLRN